MEGRVSESGSTHLKATNKARLRAVLGGLVSIVGSATSSDRLLATIDLSQSTIFTCKEHDIKKKNVLQYKNNLIEHNKHKYVQL